ncbi:MAG: BrnA antitoxin family protein [Pyrinomonadaceae bacterium]
MSKKLKEIPVLKTEDETREFWTETDSIEFVDWELAESVILPKLKPTTRTISIRISSSMLDKIRVVANKRDVPYQSLIKSFLQERIDEELKLSKV